VLGFIIVSMSTDCLGSTCSTVLMLRFSDLLSCVWLLRVVADGLPDRFYGTAGPGMVVPALGHVGVIDARHLGIRADDLRVVHLRFGFLVPSRARGFYLDGVRCEVDGGCAGCLVNPVASDVGYGAAAIFDRYFGFLSLGWA
jgi:hypothetical protein